MTVMSKERELPRYRCHKEVRALKISAIELTNDSGATITPVEDGYPPFHVEEDYVRRHRPVVGGYYVVYMDGYQSFSPGKVFEEGYSLA